MAYHPDAPTQTLATGLGWFSIGLGLAEIVAPRSLGRWLGMDDHAGLIRTFGLREVATGIGILTQKDPTPWLWGRVAGDALDLATLATAVGENNPQRRNVGLALAAVAGVTALDVMCAQALRAEAAERTRPPMKLRDYSSRSGFRQRPEAMRGAARDQVEIPRDMRIPEPLRPWDAAQA
jgi:hypothetical protein